MTETSLLPEELRKFLEAINFTLPLGFTDFFKSSNGAEISSSTKDFVLRPLADMMVMNKGYDGQVHAPESFASGSDGSRSSYAIERNTRFIHEMHFVGMSREAATLLSNTFTDFIHTID